MAITAASAGTPFSDTTNAASYVTASWTPTASRLVLVAVTNSDAANAIQPTLSGNGLTWAVALSSQRADLTKRCTVFRAWTGASPSAGTLTADFGGDAQTGCNIHISEWNGTAGSGDNGASAIVQSVAGAWSNAAHTITLASFADATNNAAYGAFETNSSSPTAGSGFTELANTVYATPSSTCLTEYRIGQDLTVDCSATGSGAGVAIEVAVAAGPSVSANAQYAYGTGQAEWIT